MTHYPWDETDENDLVFRLRALGGHLMRLDSGSKEGQLMFEAVGAIKQYRMMLSHHSAQHLWGLVVHHETAPDEWIKGEICDAERGGEIDPR